MTILLLTLSPLATNSTAQVPLTTGRHPADENVANINAAREAAAAGNYDKAIDLFRKVVRVNPNDYDAWSQLAAAYFHSGLPRRALGYLKMSEKLTNLKSYNLLYQGLAYKSLGVLGKSHIYLKNAAQFPDDFGARAMYELGVMDYKAHKDNRASYWLNLCVQRHPKSQYRHPAIKLLKSLRSGKRISLIPGADEPDFETALFKYNKLSLMPTPHYWFSQIGGAFKNKSIQDKQDGGSFKQRSDRYEALLANVGIGIGPIEKSDAIIWAGYSYFQDWTTTDDRAKIYFSDPGDIAYQPFRPDLMERRHQLYVDVSRDFPWHISAGAYTRLEFGRVGSGIFSGPELQSFKPEVQSISDTTWFIPWIGYNWNTDMRTFVYLYFRKEINAEVPDYSNKSYNFEVNSGDTVPLSLGLTHEMVFPKFKTEASAELYTYEFIGNDPWLDYSRRGGNFTVEHQLIPQLFVVLSGGYFQDAYIETILRNDSCDTNNLGTEGASGLVAEVSSPIDCTRDETGTIIRVGTFWNFTQFQRLGGELSYVNNTNERQKEFSQTQLSLLGTATIAFPSVKRTLKYSSRFADPGFVKKDQ